MEIGKINRQQYRVYKGQALSGNELGCLTGLKRKKLIAEDWAVEYIYRHKLI